LVVARALAPRLSDVFGYLKILRYRFRNRLLRFYWICIRYDLG
jgi:hypothetical protein